MPKKKVSPPSKKPIVKKASSKSTSTRKTVAAKTTNKKTSAARKKSVGGAVAKAVPVSRQKSKPVATKTAPASNPASSHSEISLGRPLVTQEEKLYMLFHDDYQARQVFEFLRVESVKELEQFSQQQIVHMMSKPLRMTVERIRQRLAQYKRSLKDDEQFAADYLKHAD